MMFDILKGGLVPATQLVPVEQLLRDGNGSRMPDVYAERLTPELARAAVDACPTPALALEAATLTLDYGACIGCGRCLEAGGGAFVRAAEFRRTGLPRGQLLRRWDLARRVELTEVPDEGSARREILSAMGRALNIRQLDAGSCNGCEAEIVALTNPFYDLERFGIHFVASPKHADMLLVTGPVTRNMAEAVKKTYEAVPSPKVVVAVGACGVSGGLFAGSHAVVGPVDSVIAVDAYIPGCPPTPAMLVAGILRTVRRHFQRSTSGPGRSAHGDAGQ